MMQNKSTHSLAKKQMVLEANIPKISSGDKVFSKDFKKITQFPTVFTLEITFLTNGPLDVLQQSKCVIL